MKNLAETFRWDSKVLHHIAKMDRGRQAPKNHKKANISPILRLLLFCTDVKEPGFRVKTFRSASALTKMDSQILRERIRVDDKCCLAWEDAKHRADEASEWSGIWAENRHQNPPLLQDQQHLIQFKVFCHRHHLKSLQWAELVRFSPFPVLSVYFLNFKF